MERPLLSIIIPVYNVSNYIERCLNSIIEQPYKEIEIIIVDDGSTDGSSEIIDKYVAEDKRVIAIHQSNQGVSAARNAALGRSTGKYITFVDSDDFIRSDTYNLNMEYLLNHPEVDILQFPYCHYINDKNNSKLVCPEKRKIVGAKDIFSSWWSGTPIEYVVWNKIYKRELWENISFIKGHVSEDTILAATFCKIAKIIYISDIGMYYYQRNRTGSYTYRYSFNKHIDLFNAHLKMYELFALYPEMVTEKVLAFTRLYRRLIHASLSCRYANIEEQKKLISESFPLWKEIFLSVGTDKKWLCIAKFLGVRVFMSIFIFYIKLKKVE